MIEEIDFLISGVKYDDDDMIEKVSVHEKMDQYGVGYPFEESREEVVDKIKEGSKYYTLISEDDGKFDFMVGEEIKLIEVDGKEYIRIDEQKDPFDNLGKVTRVRDIEQF